MTCSPELESRLLASGKTEVYEQLVNISKLANISYIRQKETKGLGHAILCAKTFVGNDPFAVLYGDDVIIGDKPACGQLCEAYQKYGLGVVGIKEVSLEAIQKYSSMKTEHLQDNMFRISDMVEKPKPEEVFSLYSILGRCVLPPEDICYFRGYETRRRRRNPINRCYEKTGAGSRHDRRGFCRQAI